MCSLYSDFLFFLKTVSVLTNGINRYLTERCRFVISPRPAGNPSSWTFSKRHSFPWTKRHARWQEQAWTNEENQPYVRAPSVIKLSVCECVCKRESLLWVMAISGGGTMAKESGCRKYCLQGAFNTSQENRISLPLSLSVSSRCHIKTSGKHETQLLCLFG